VLDRSHHHHKGKFVETGESALSAVIVPGFQGVVFPTVKWTAATITVIRVFAAQAIRVIGPALPKVMWIAAAISAAMGTNAHDSRLALHKKILIAQGNSLAGPALFAFREKSA